jgi:hypothetical protein
LGSIPWYQQGTATGWSLLSNLAVPAGFSITTLAVSKQSSSNVLYYGLSPSNSVPAKIYRFINATSATDGEVGYDLPASSGGGYVHRIAINPINSNEILVVLSNYKLIGLYHSTNGGQAFTAVEGNLEGTDGNGPSLRSATILPLPSGTAYFIGTSTGVYSTNILNGAGTVWSQEGADKIGNVVVEDITSRVSDYRVAVGTHGRGIFIGTRDPLPVEDSGGHNQPQVFSLNQNYPNPFNPSTKITYSLPSPQHVIIKVYDMLGREVDDIVNVNQEAGIHTVEYRPESLASGIYIYSVSAGPYQDAQKFILLR